MNLKHFEHITQIDNALYLIVPEDIDDIIAHNIRGVVYRSGLAQIDITIKQRVADRMLSLK